MTGPVLLAAEPAATPALAGGIPERVLAHMEGAYPDGSEAGDWQIARDYRDDTAIVVWRCTGDLLTMPRIRGQQLYRWLGSLHDAGFTVQARTDMEAFGRPGEESADGIAHWLHVTGWQPTQSRTPETLSEIAKRLRNRLGVVPEHNVTLDPGLVPQIDGRRVHGIRFATVNGALRVAVAFEDEALLLPDPPGWVADLARAHEGHGEAWCYPHGCPGEEN
ncbi:hypothetical protein ACW4TU_18610 [Streptomyces sp. QTS52]